MEDDNAVLLFDLANQACLDENGVQDENCLYHIQQLTNRESMGEENFLKYMKSIAGNPNYDFPYQNNC